MKNSVTREQLNSIDKDTLASMHLNLQAQMAEQMETIKELRAQIEKLTEQITLMNTRTFSRKTETKLIIDCTQLSMFDDILNEAEVAIEGKTVIEPEIDQVVVPEHKRRKRKGKREEILSGFPTVVIEHALTDEELNEKFPEGYSSLPDEVYKKLEIIPATFEVHEHHIKVYKGKNGKIAKGEHPKEMLNNSIATPSLVAAIINDKYTNSMPLHRQEQEYARMDVELSRQVMGNWVIRTAERYISLIYDKIKEEIKNSPVIHSDETPVMVTKDGREGMHKNYMWVYRTGDMCEAKPAVLYDYQKTRNVDAANEFLHGYDGTVECDGYIVYRALRNAGSVKFRIAGCWAHARRPFATIVKSLGEENAIETIAYEALVQIRMIYHTDNKLKKLPPSERKAQRKQLVEPLVDNYFNWAKESILRVPPRSATAEGIRYSLNQEEYLRTFLEDPAVPLDNNLAEQAIRPFCVGKNNWKLIDTVEGAKASAILYSIVETAKANDLVIYQYLKYLLTEIPKHMDDTSLDFLDDMLPWSNKLPEECYKKKLRKK